MPVIGIGAGRQHRRPGARAARPARHPRRAQAEVRQAASRRARRDGARRAALRRGGAQRARSRRPSTPTGSRPRSSSGCGAQSAASHRGLMTRSQSHSRYIHWRAMARLSQLFAPREREFFDLFEEAGANIVRAAALLEQMLEPGPTKRELAREIGRLRAGGRPHHPRHHPAAQLDVRHADRPRGHLRARLRARRHRRLHRGGRGLPRPLPDRGADGPGAASSARILHQAAAQIAGAIPRLRTFRDIRHYTVEINRLENEGDRSCARRSRRCSSAGIDPMLVIRWKDIFERLEDAVDATETRRTSSRASSSRTPSGLGHGERRRPLDRRRHGARVRLHQRLPRHRERGRDLDLHARACRRASRSRWRRS